MVCTMYTEKNLGWLRNGLPIVCSLGSRVDNKLSPLSFCTLKAAQFLTCVRLCVVGLHCRGAKFWRSHPKLQSMCRSMYNWQAAWNVLALPA